MKKKSMVPGLAGAAVLVLLAGCGAKNAEHAATTREAEPAVVSGMQFASVATEAVPLVRELAGSVQAAVSVPYPAEYRATRDNAALLRSIAERTGGRVLRLADAKTWELFDRSDLGSSSTARALWQLAAILAAVLILIDVAWRRIAFDRRDAQELAARMTGGASSAGSGGVDALRRAREGAASGGTGAVTDAGRSGRGAAKPTGGAPAATRFEAGEGAPKIDARDMAAGDAGTGSAPTAPRPVPKDAAPDEADGLSRLRAARRRAQDRNDGEGGA